MGGICKIIKGLLFLVAGGVILAPTLGVTAIQPMLAVQITGACIALVGVMILMHAAGMCKMCSCCKDKEGKCCK